MPAFEPSAPADGARILIVKTSSMGDIVHALPALEDARRARPDLRFDWVSEQAFAELPAWHPAVERVLSCRLRAWRQAPLTALRSGEWRRFRAALRERSYVCVIDAQGLVKSAWLARLARGPAAGPDRRSAREPLAAWLYRRRFPVPRFDVAHAVTRNRLLFAQALGYPAPDLAAPPDYGLRRDRFPAPASGLDYLVFLHGTSWASKQWPTPHWRRLAEAANARGLRVLLPWGSARERATAEEIAAGHDAEVLPRLDLTALAGRLAWARAVVGVDTGLMHLAAALMVPGLSLYGPTLPALTGALGHRQTWLRDDAQATTIDRDRALSMPPEPVIAALDRMLG